jgi:hypothetical protein
MVSQHRHTQLWSCEFQHQLQPRPRHLTVVPGRKISDTYTNVGDGGLPPPKTAPDMMKKQGPTHAGSTMGC